MSFPSLSDRFTSISGSFRAPPRAALLPPPARPSWPTFREPVKAIPKEQTFQRSAPILERQNNQRAQRRARQVHNSRQTGNVVKEVHPDVIPRPPPPRPAQRTALPLRPRRQERPQNKQALRLGHREDVSRKSLLPQPAILSPPVRSSSPLLRTAPPRLSLGSSRIQTRFQVRKRSDATTQRPLLPAPSGGGLLSSSSRGCQAITRTVSRTMSHDKLRLSKPILSISSAASAHAKSNPRSGRTLLRKTGPIPAAVVEQRKVKSKEQLDLEMDRFLAQNSKPPLGQQRSQNNGRF
jgi:hypothetical protein